MRPRFRTVFALVLASVVAPSEVVNAEDKGARGEDFVARMFKIEHQSAESIAKAIRHLGSGDRDSKIETNESLDTITVRDRPSNVAVIEHAVKQLDVPRPDVSFQIRVLIAGPTGETSVPADMQKVVRELKQNLQFKAYTQVSALTHRVRSGGRIDSKGTIQLVPPAVEKPTRADYDLELRPVVSGARRGSRTVQVRSLSFELDPDTRDIGNAEIRTDVVIPEGETVVVGTAALGPRALVLVMWASTSGG